MSDLGRNKFDVFTTPLADSHLIEASAGTGKTWSITGLYVRAVVEKSLLPERILVVTFTKAATAELTGRIRTRVYQTLQWLNGDTAEKSLKAEATFFEPLFAQWKVMGLSDEDIKTRLVAALAGFDRAAIFTIHSFCQRLLADFAFEANARFDLSLVTDADLLLDTVIADFWRNKVSALDENDAMWAHWLIEGKNTPEVWRKAIKSHLNKPYVELLPPKDVESAQKDAADLVAEVVRIQEVACTMWHDDNAEIRDAFTALIDSGVLHKSTYKQANLSQYFDALERFLAKEMHVFFKAIDKDDMLKDARKFDCEFIDVKTNKNLVAIQHPFYGVVSALFSAHAALVEGVKAQFEQRKMATIKELVETVNRELPALKSQLGVIDFDDMLLLVHQALQGSQANELVAAVRAQYHAALIDEFQDTDPLQLDIFTQLFAGNDSADDSGDADKNPSTLFFVGDPKQAIYSFRGADIYAYYQGAENTKRQSTLVTNYRSSPRYVDSVNALFSPNHSSFISPEIHFDWVAAQNKPELTITDASGQPDTSQGAMHFVIARPEPNAKGEFKAFSKTQVEDLAIADTVSRIEALLSKGSQGRAQFVDLDKGTTTNIVPSDIAILVPKHAQAKKLSAALAKRHILSVRQGQDKVMQSDAAVTLLRLMQAVFEPQNDARITELMGDGFIGLTGLAIKAMKDDAPAWETHIAQFITLKKTWSEEGFSAMFRSWLASQLTHDGKTLAEQAMEFVDGERRLTDIMHLAEILQQQSTGHQVSQKALIHWLQHGINRKAEEDEHQLRLESDSKRVKIVTLHASKGLEYNIVFCPFLWQGKNIRDDDILAAHNADKKAVVSFRSETHEDILKRANEESLMEQLRLLYVALTRPVHQCVIFWANAHSGQYVYTRQSALAWLLYADSSCEDDPVARLNAKVKATDTSPSDFEQVVFDFAGQASQRNDGNRAQVTCEIYQDAATIADVSGLKGASSSIAADTLMAASNTGLKHAYPASWYQTSFSGLTKDQHAHIDPPRRDDETNLEALPELEAAGSESEKLTMFGFWKGADAGNAIHGIFEHCDFSSADDTALNTLVGRMLNRFAVPPKKDQREQWVGVVAQRVKDTLTKPLSAEKSFSLSQVPVGQRQAEMDFLMTAKGDTTAFQTLLAKAEFKVPAVFQEASKQLDYRSIQGFLTGSIDLVFQDDEGRFHVLDWKSNYLGSQFNDYSPDSIERSMAASHYYLQALIYLVALHRYLKSRVADYNINQHLGSAWYVYVRGINASQADGEPPTGIYHYPPALALIEAIDQLFDTATEDSKEAGL